MHILVLALALSLISCQHFERPQYRSPASYTPTQRAINPNLFELSWPIEKARFTRGFSPHRKRHFGIDMAAPTGHPIHAAHSGKVIYKGSNDYRGFGKLVIIEHPSGWGSMYAHCHSIYVREGDWVERGDKIASVGSTGRSTGPHLHFELRKDKRAVDPLKYLP